MSISVEGYRCCSHPAGGRGEDQKGAVVKKDKYGDRKLRLVLT